MNILLRKSIILIFLILLISGCKSNSLKINININKMDDLYNTYYGYLKIPKIDLNMGFFNYNDSLNDVNKNIEFINTNIKNTYLFAGHSGVGNLAYFNDLLNLNINDLVYIDFKNKILEYEIINIKRVKKDGKIKISNKENMLYLTTCDQVIDNYQLIIEAKLKEKE